MLTGRFDVVHAVEEAAHLAAPLARVLGLPLVVDVDSSIPDQLRESGFARRGPLPWTAAALERHALRHAAAVITVCTSLTEGVRARAPEAAVFQVEDPPLVDADPRPRRTRWRSCAPRCGSTRVPSSCTRATSRSTRAWICWWRRRRGCRRRSSCSWAASRARSRQARARARRAGSRATAASSRASAARRSCRRFLALADLVASPRRRGVNTPFKVYTYLASGRPAAGHAHPQPHPGARRHQRLAGGGDAGGAGRRHPRRAAPIPTRRPRRAARDAALVEREYSAAALRGEGPAPPTATWRRSRVAAR